MLICQDSRPDPVVFLIGRLSFGLRVIILPDQGGKRSAIVNDEQGRINGVIIEIKRTPTSMATDSKLPRF